ncbi:MAG: tRNA (guanosine(37)-N1)-methyltransferase TrmD [Melioribacteraceae bacterium]|nr:tRNA (guanosine(37)-N1)-methyltransferase TrmD [Melioribacteraceae bacterium]
MTKMRFDVISAVPDLMVSNLQNSIIKRAQDKHIVEIYLHSLRDYTTDKHRMIDDKPFGGSSGMVLKPEPFFNCFKKLLSERSYDNVIFSSAGGKKYDQSYAKKFSLAKNIIIVAGHYKGIDDRVRERFATDEISIGNFILSGGELLALVIIDSVVRLLPGVLGDSDSALTDSFIDDQIIAAPEFTRPAEIDGMKVPDVLLSGNEKEIIKWKNRQSEILTKKWKKNNSSE